LFLSTNPGFSSGEDYPTGDRALWPDDRIEDYFVHRFGGGAEAWTWEGRRGRSADGSYAAKDNGFWAFVAGKARDILRRDALRGEDWALTEVVHCKSDKGKGVGPALARCPERYLLRVITASAARLIVCLGRPRVWPTFLKAYPAVAAAAPHIAAASGRLREGALVGPLPIAGRHRYVAFLEHPMAGSTRLSKLVTPGELATLRQFLEEARSDAAGDLPQEQASGSGEE
jgi:hypothetical protein